MNQPLSICRQHQLLRLFSVYFERVASSRLAWARASLKAE